MGHFGRAFGPRVRRVCPYPHALCVCLLCVRAMRVRTMHVGTPLTPDAGMCVWLCLDGCSVQGVEEGRLHETDGGGQARGD
jgi:hypothetical protein